MSRLIRLAVLAGVTTAALAAPALAQSYDPNLDLEQRAVAQDRARLDADQARLEATRLADAQYSAQGYGGAAPVYGGSSPGYPPTAYGGGVALQPANYYAPAPSARLWFNPGAVRDWRTERWLAARRAARLSWLWRANAWNEYRLERSLARQEWARRYALGYYGGYVAPPVSVYVPRVRGYLAPPRIWLR